MTPLELLPLPSGDVRRSVVWRQITACIHGPTAHRQLHTQTVVHPMVKEMGCFYLLAPFLLPAWRLVHLSVPTNDVLYISHTNCTSCYKCHHGKMANESVEITNKMQFCNRIYYSKIYWRLNVFRAAHRSSSGAPNCIYSLWFIYCNKLYLVNKKVQLYVTICRHLFTAKSLYMFRASQHPSSGALKTVTATSGIGHNTGTATSFQCGLLRTQSWADHIGRK